MHTLQQREELTDQLWEMLYRSRDEREERENIKALEFNYIKIDKLRAGQRIKIYEDMVLDQLLVKLKAESIIREENKMTSEQEGKQCKVIGWLMFIVSIAVLAAIAASGCRTVKGAADGFMLDGQAMFNYAVDHKDSSTQNP